MHVSPPLYESMLFPFGFRSFHLNICYYYHGHTACQKEVIWAYQHAHEHVCHDRGNDISMSTIAVYHVR